MRRLLAILATLAAVTAAAPPASATVDTSWIKFNWCDVRNAQKNLIHICSAIEVRRQDDGNGLKIRRVTHYLDITRAFGSGDPADCDPGIVEQDPAVKNNYTWIDAENIDGGYVATKWERSSPAGNIGGWNNCSMEWTQVGLDVGTNRLESGYNYWLRINGLPDITAENTIDVYVSGTSLLMTCYVSDRCNRTVL